MVLCVCVCVCFGLVLLVSQEKKLAETRDCVSLYDSNPNPLPRCAGAQWRTLCSFQGRVPSPPFPAAAEMARPSLMEPFPEWPVGISQGSIQAFNALMTQLGQI